MPLMEQMEARVDDVGRAVQLLVASDHGERAVRLAGSLLGVAVWRFRAEEHEAGTTSGGSHA